MSKEEIIGGRCMNCGATLSACVCGVFGKPPRHLPITDDKKVKAYYDRCIKRIEELRLMHDIEIYKEEILEILKEELNVDNLSGSKKEKD